MNALLSNPSEPSSSRARNHPKLIDGCPIRETVLKGDVSGAWDGERLSAWGCLVGSVPVQRAAHPALGQEPRRSLKPKSYLHRLLEEYAQKARGDADATSVSASRGDGAVLRGGDAQAAHVGELPFQQQGLCAPSRPSSSRRDHPSSPLRIREHEEAVGRHGCHDPA